MKKFRDTLFLHVYITYFLFMITEHLLYTLVGYHIVRLSIHNFLFSLSFFSHPVFNIFFVMDVVILVLH